MTLSGQGTETHFWLNVGSLIGDECEESDRFGILPRHDGYPSPKPSPQEIPRPPSGSPQSENLFVRPFNLIVVTDVCGSGNPGSHDVGP